MLLAPQVYDPQWPARYQGLRDALVRATGNACVFHIGSTAVPGLRAKPIIDLQLGVVSLDGFCSDPLQDAGFEFAPEINRDDMPLGAAGRPQDWRKKYARCHRDGHRIAHLHIRQMDLPNFRLALLFRDYLRADDIAAAHYGAFKLQAGQVDGARSEAGGSGAYLDLKDPVVALLMMLSERWADATNWQIPAS